MYLDLVNKRTIGDLVKQKERRIGNENSIVDRVPCRGCQKFYIGETSRSLKTRISEHRRDLRNHRLTNSMVLHARDENHLPLWEKAEQVKKKGLTKRHRKILESSLIESVPCAHKPQRRILYAGNCCMPICLSKVYKDF